MLKLTSIVLIIGALAITSRAQHTVLSSGSDDQPVANEDGGQAYILERNLQPLSSPVVRRKGTIAAPQQVSIFVGASWETPAMREREQLFQGLFANMTNEADLAALQARGIKNRFGPTAAVERLDLASRIFSDLDVQRLLASMFETHALPEPNSRTIFILFLDANFGSTLGSLSGGKHYVAYHNTFRTSGTKVHYIVAPFESDENVGYQLALRALVAAASNPGTLVK